MLLAQRFGMTYVDKDGQEKTPYIIHRTSLGCYERTLAYLLEKYAGALPMWMMPTQCVVIPLGEEYADYAAEVVKELKSNGLRVELDDRNETMGKRIREAQLEKIPYMLVVGAKEKEDGTVSVRSRKGENIGAMSVKDAATRFVAETKAKTIG